MTRFIVWTIIVTAILLLLAVAASPALADSAGGSSGGGGFDWNTVWPIITTIAGLLGLGHVVDHAKAKALAWEKTVLDAAAREARAIGRSVIDKVVAADGAFVTWERRFMAWVDKQGKKLPEPLQGKALAAAHQIFQELHLYTDPMSEACARLEIAVKNFQDQLPAELKMISTFPTVASPPPPKTPPIPPPPLKDAA